MADLGSRASSDQVDVAADALHGGTPGADVVIVDVVIVGGGPVGLAAAIEARLAGLTVTLIEQRAGTIDKACGEGLMPGALPLLARLGVDPAGEPLRGVMYRQGASTAIHRFAGDGSGRGVRRTELHRALAIRVDELGVRRITAKVSGVNSGATVASVRASGSDGAVTVVARYVFGCDGLHSAVARLVGLSESAGRAGVRAATSTSNRANRSRRYGVRQHYARAPWSDNIEVYYGAEAEFYVTPVAADTVGLAMLARRGTDFDAALAAIPELAARLAGVAAASTRRGAGPFKQRTRGRTAGRVLLLGDASGYVDAITGEGLRLGFAQARAAVRCILADTPRTEASRADTLRAYERQWKRETRNFRLLTTGLVLLATSPFRKMIVPLAERFPALFGVIVERLAR
jgi:flavin-dependent dehydrogenase